MVFTSLGGHWFSSEFCLGDIIHGGTVFTQTMGIYWKWDYWWRKWKSRILLWLTKKRHFVPSLWTDICNTILEVDPPCTIISLVVDTRANKMKSWYLWEAWEVRHRRLSTWQPKKVFVSLSAYWRSWNLLDPTVHYFTVGHYLQSRRHQRSLLSLSRRGTHSQERSVTRNCR